MGEIKAFLICLDSGCNLTDNASNIDTHHYKETMHDGFSN